MTADALGHIVLALVVGAAGCACAQTPDSTASGAPATARVAFVTPAAVQPRQHDQATIFWDDFEQAGDLHDRYFEYDDANGGFVRSPEAGYAGRGHGMKCQFEQGQVSAGSLKVAFGRNPVGGKLRPHDTFGEIYWRVYVRQQAGWEGNPVKLARATCLAGSDWSQGLIAHVWAGEGDMLCIDPATGIRDNRKVTAGYNDFDHLRWLGSIQGHTPLFSPTESGRWVCVESRVNINTPGQRDGAFLLWIDGHLEASRTDLDWHGTWDDYAIDAVFLENYWNQGAKKREARYFDDFVISTRPIGPVVAAEVPTLTRTATPVSAWQAQVSASPDDTDLVWTSKVTDGRELSLSMDSAHGTFSGSRADSASRASGMVHWLRLRERTASGEWSQWSSWHAPFCTGHRQ